MQQSVFEEQFDGLFAQSLDVHRLAADKVDDAAQYLRPAVALIGTVVLAFALVFHQRSAAFRTAGDVLEGTAVRRTGRKIDARDLGDDLAAFSTYTISPTRMSSRAICSALCSVARLTVVPANCTGSRLATG